MSVFLDSGFFIALLNSRDQKHTEAKNILFRLKKKATETRITTDYVLDEVVTTLWGTTHRKDIVQKAYGLICETPAFITLKYFPKEEIESAWSKWINYAEFPKHPLSFTDCTILAYMEKQQIDSLITFDSEFKGLVDFF
jgi:predicted nucleic acid-binding protein